jgi:acetate kinase
MKRLVVFDLDGTLAESKQAIDAEMTGLCERLAWLGVALDAGPNAAGATRISTADSKIEVLVYAIDEESTIARHTHAVLSRKLATVDG